MSVLLLSSHLQADCRGHRLWTVLCHTVPTRVRRVLQQMPRIKVRRDGTGGVLVQWVYFQQRFVGRDYQCDAESENRPADTLETATAHEQEMLVCVLLPRLSVWSMQNCPALSRPRLCRCSAMASQT